MYELRYLSGAERFFTKLKENGLKILPKILMQEKAKPGIYREFTVMMFITTKPIMRLPIAFMMKVAN